LTTTSPCEYGFLRHGTVLRTACNEAGRRYRAVFACTGAEQTL